MRGQTKVQVLYFFNKFLVNLALIGFTEVKNNIFKLKTKIRWNYTSIEYVVNSF